MSVFNRCIETGNVLLILECWQDVHPALVSIPVKWEYSSPYGLLGVNVQEVKKGSFATMV